MHDTTCLLALLSRLPAAAGHSNVSLRSESKHKACDVCKQVERAYLWCSPQLQVDTIVICKVLDDLHEQPQQQTGLLRRVCAPVAVHARGAYPCSVTCSCQPVSHSTTKQPLLIQAPTPHLTSRVMRVMASCLVVICGSTQQRKEWCVCVTKWGAGVAGVSPAPRATASLTADRASNAQQCLAATPAQHPPQTLST